MEELHKAENTVYTNEIVFDGQAEQGVELNYVLPDYYPEIFKILKCCLTPKVVSYSVSDDSKLMLDGVVYIKVLYLAENSNNVHCVEQRYTYSKIIEFNKKSAVPIFEPIVSIFPKTDYVNCRAVSSRRIDVRGAVSCKVRISAQKHFEMPELPEGLLVRTKSVSCCGRQLCAEKTVTIREEIETGAAGIDYIVSCDAVPKISDVRIIADKAVIKGSITVNSLYGVHSSDGTTEMEKMTADIPVSQIMDIVGISDEHVCRPEITVLNCELLPKSDSGIVSCEIIAQCRTFAKKVHEITIPVDVYSTDFECELSAAQLKVEAAPQLIKQQFAVRSSIAADSGEIESVWDCRSELFNPVCRANGNGEIKLTGQLFCQAIGRTTGGVPFFAEKQEPFEQSISCNISSDEITIEHNALVCDTGYSIRTDGTLDITAQVDFSGAVSAQKVIEAVNGVELHEDKPKEKENEYALRICYTDGTEDCWAVAKRYNTTPDAILSENDIEDENAPISGMVLIPTM